MAPQTDRGIPAAGWPEIILTETPGPLLEVDALIYPEDTYLIVDPYTPIKEPEDSSKEIMAE